jgi:hypothetical protein
MAQGDGSFSSLAFEFCRTLQDGSVRVQYLGHIIRLSMFRIMQNRLHSFKTHGYLSFLSWINQALWPGHCSLLNKVLDFMGANPNDSGRTWDSVICFNEVSDTATLLWFHNGLAIAGRAAFEPSTLRCISNFLFVPFPVWDYVLAAGIHMLAAVSGRSCSMCANLWNITKGTKACCIAVIIGFMMPRHRTVSVSTREDV